jgi:hypothetical protein
LDSKDIKFFESKGSAKSQTQFPKYLAPHPVIRNASDALKVMYTPERGRYVTASRDIDVGECLIHEEAFVNILKFEESLTHCYNCHKDVFVNPLPCEKCAAVVFCSTECSTKAESWYN